MFDKLNGAHLRLAAYITAVALGVYQVITGAVAAGDIADAVASTDAQLGIILAALGGLAGANIDRTGRELHVDVADLPTVRAAVADVIAGHATAAVADVAERVDTAKHRLEDRVNVNIQQSADPRELLADMQRRIDATRAGRAARD